jgi:antirestriction protein ArdC
MPSVYEIVTEKIIKQLESGVAPWRKPWTCQVPANLLTQKEYRGLNVFTLASQGFPSRFWLTFNQATKLGGRIRKGEKSSPVIFWNVGEDRETITPDGARKTLRPFLLRYYRSGRAASTKLAHKECSGSIPASARSIKWSSPNRTLCGNAL